VLSCVEFAVEKDPDMHLTHPALIMLLAGIGIPVLATMNARLGANIGSPAAAGVVLCVVGMCAATVVMLRAGTPALGLVVTQPKYLFLAGVLMAFYVLSITYIAPTFGVGNAVFFVLIGQLISAAVIDHFGLLGANVTPLSAMRALGIAVMAAGVAITQFAPKG